MKERCWLAGVSLSVFAVALTFLSTARVYAVVSENSEPSAWTNTYKFGPVVVSNVVGMKACVGVHFPWSDPGSPPPMGLVYLVTGGDPQVSPFAGDFLANGMKSLAFRLSTTTNIMSVSAILKGTASSTVWKHRIAVPQIAGTWSTVVVPLELDGGWYMSTVGDADASQWTQALVSVSYVGLIIERNGFSNQVATVDSFILAGNGFVTPPTALLALGDALDARFGVRNYGDLSAAQKALDTDKDGMTDVNEILAGTNPDNPNSIFAASIVAVKSLGVTLEWPCVNGGVYTVSRCSDLVVGSFRVLVDGYRLTATQDGTMTFTDKSATTDGGPYFYRIVKE